MNPARLARRNARLCPMHAQQGPYTRPDGDHWHTIDLVEVRGVRTLLCYWRPRTGPRVSIALISAMAGMGFR